MAGPIRRLFGWLSGEEPGAQTWPPPAEPAAGPRGRMVLSRRLRQLRAEREAALEELGSMALDMHRRDAVRAEYLGKGAEEVAELSREIAALEQRLGIAPDEPTTEWEAEEEPEPPPPPEPEPEPAPEPPPPPEPEPEPAPEPPPEQQTTVAWTPTWEEERAAEGDWPQRTRGSWRVPLAVALTVAGACGLFLVLDYSSKRDDAREQVGADAVAATTTTATTRTTGTARTTTTPERTTTEAEPSRSTRPARWPQGRSGWTVSLLTSTNEGEATNRAREAIGRGLRAGVIDSARVEGVSSGQLIVFAGRYESRAQAENAVSRATEAGYSGAYPISVRG